LKRAEFERALLKPETTKQVLALVQSFGSDTNAAIHPPGGVLSEHQPPKSLAWAMKTPTSFHPGLVAFFRVPGIGMDLSPLDALKLAMRHFQNHPTKQANALALAAVNNALTSREPDSAIRHEVDTALSVLRATSVAGEAADAIVARFFEHANLAGRSVVLVDNGGFSGRMRANDLRAVGLHDTISSLSLSTDPPEFLSSLLVFEHDRYVGNFRGFEISGGGNRVVNYIGDMLNDRISSALTFRHTRTDVRIVLGDLLIREVIDREIEKADGIYPRGGTELTWDAYPAAEQEGEPYSPWFSYILVKIPFSVDVPHWWDYDAEFRIWVRPILDGSGQLQLFIAFSYMWVDGGFYHDEIRDRLVREFSARLGTFTSLFNGIAALINLQSPFRGVSLLPGAMRGGDYIGATTDDVTLVLEKGTPLPPPG
jgi:hypothetical protein